MIDHNVIVHELFVRICKEDKKAFTVFFRMYYEKFIKVALIYVKGYCNAEDIVSEVFIKILKREKKLLEIERIDGYLFLMVKNQCLDFLKRTANQSNFQQLDEHDGHYFYGEGDLRKEIEGNELKVIINKCIENFPPKRKIVYRLIKQNGLKYKEVAEILSISSKTVENHIDFALKSLRIVIEKYLKESSGTASIRPISGRANSSFQGFLG